MKANPRAASRCRSAPASAARRSTCRLRAMILATAAGAAAGRVGRARPLPQPGESRARHQGALGTRALSPTPAGREDLTLEHLAAAPLHTPCEPVATSPRRATARPPPWPRPSSPRMPTCSPSSRVSMRPTAPTRLPGRHGTLLDVKYLAQQGHRLTATVIKDLPNGALVRADTLPWCSRWPASRNAARTCA